MFDQQQFRAEMKQRITEIQGQLKDISDDELMRLNENIYEKPEHERDAAFMAAVYNETQRRFIASGWFWRRWLKPQRYEKWVNHNRIIESKATKEAIDNLQDLDDPASQEAVRRLEGYLEDLKNDK